ncbi:MAG: hypothetical protein V3T83_02155, partial [Acidobacteriota bacterium]
VYLPGDGSLSLQEASRLLQAEGLELKEFHRQTPTLEQALLERIRQARSDGWNRRPLRPTSAPMVDDSDPPANSTSSEAKPC